MAGRESWNAAGLAQKRPPKKERKLYPHTVGEQPAQQSQSLRSCKGCGYHLCGCARKHGRQHEENLYRREYMGVRSDVVEANRRMAEMNELKAERARRDIEELQLRYERARSSGASVSADTYRRQMLQREESIRRMAAVEARNRAEAALRETLVPCPDCARARREMVTHCMCGRPTGC